jgi:hypothetical protein
VIRKPKIQWTSKTFRAEDGRIYQRDGSGVIHRLSPLKPHRNKAEMKAHKRKRMPSKTMIGVAVQGPLKSGDIQFINT